MVERWTLIEDGSYELSDHGIVRRLRPAKGATVGATIRPSPDKDGYMQIGMWIDHHKVTRKLHRLVGLAFLPAPRPGQVEINHKNGDKADNHYSNLEWATGQENKDHAWTSGLCDSRFKLDARAIVALEALTQSGMTQTEAAQRFGVHQTAVSFALCGKRRHVHALS